jgi:hypothetical protein
MKNYKKRKKISHILSDADFKDLNRRYLKLKMRYVKFINKEKYFYLKCKNKSLLNYFYKAKNFLFRINKLKGTRLINSVFTFKLYFKRKFSNIKRRPISGLRRLNKI